MIIYWVIFSFLAFFSISPINIEKQSRKILFLFLLFFLIFFIGLRDEVGGDWYIYERDFILNLEVFDILKFEFVKDFGYEFISYVSNIYGFGIFGVNLFCSIVFIYALYQFAKRQPNTSLVFLISFPYIITVIAMGYTRQATAFAFVILAMISLMDKKIMIFYFYVFLAIIFHKSSPFIIIFIMLSFFDLDKKLIFSIVLLSVFSYLNLQSEFERIIGGYFGKVQQYESYGVMYRIIINLIAGLFFLLFINRLSFSRSEKKLLLFLILANFISIFYINDYSTLIDRLMLYFVLLQLFVMPRLFLLSSRFGILINISVIMYYFVIFFIWLNFSNYSDQWIPYNNLLFNL